jgi:hypothetical protein
VFACAAPDMIAVCVCVSVDIKVYVCDEFSEVAVMLTGGDKVMDDGQGVGLSVAIIQAKQSKHKASGTPQLHIRHTRPMISRSWVGLEHSYPKTTLCTYPNMKKWLGAAKLSTSSSTHSLSALDEPQARRFPELVSLHGTCG